MANSVTNNYVFSYLSIMCLLFCFIDYSAPSEIHSYIISPAGTSDTPTYCEFSSSSSIPATTCRNIQPILEQFINVSSEVDVTIRVASGKYDAPLSLQGLYLPRVSLFLVPADSIAQIECPDKYNSFLSNIAVFFNLTDLKTFNMSNFHFTKCGPISPTIYFQNVTSHATFYNLNFTNNTQSAFLFLTSYSITILSCSFINNTLTYNNTYLNYFEESGFEGIISPEAKTQKGGVIIVELDLNNTFPNNSHYFLQISNSNFIDNKCRQVDYYAPVPHFFGAAISIAFFRENFNIFISKNIFIDNCSCRHGGAISIYNFAHNFHAQYSSIHDNLFLRNKANHIGGAIHLYFRPNDEFKYNVLDIFQNNFTANIAIVGGGGISIHFAGIDDLNFQNFDFKTRQEIKEQRYSSSKINLFNNVWLRNFALAERSGNSIRLLSFTKFAHHPPTVFLRDMLFVRGSTTCDECVRKESECLSEGRNIGRGLSNHEMVFAGALVYFERNITLIGAGNAVQCGGILQISSYLFVAENLIIKNYSTISGSGIYNKRNSRILFYSNANMTLSDNHATLYGGAIVNEYTSSAGKSNSETYNVHCVFGLMSNPRAPLAQWNVTLKFVNNSAKTAGGAIYTNQIKLCTWISEEPPYFNNSLALNYPNVFIYENNTLVFEEYLEIFNTTYIPSDISSSPARLEIPTNVIPGSRINGSKSWYFPVMPGELLLVPLIAYDVNNKPTLAVVDIIDTCEMRTKFQYNTLFIDLKLYYCLLINPNEPGACDVFMNYFLYELQSGTQTCKDKDFEFILNKGVLGGNDNNTKNFINFSPEFECRTGYTLDEDGSCKCDTSLSALDKCNQQGAYFFDGYWIGPITTTNNSNGGLSNPNDITKYSIYSCPVGYCSCHQSNSSVSCLQKSDPSKYCRRNTSGVMCGDCDEHHTHMAPFGCVPHPSSNFIWVLVFYMIMTTAVCVVVFLLNIRTWNGIRSSVLVMLLIQFISFLNVSLQTGLPEGSIVLSQLISLNFIVIPKTVPIKDMSYLLSLSLNCYPVFIVLIIGVTAAGLAILLKRFQFSILQSKRLIDSFLFLWFLVYGKLVVIIFKTVVCVGDEKEGNFRLFYSGKVKCFEGEHISYFILSAIMFCLLIIPTPIVLCCITNRFFLRRYLKLAVIVSGFNNNARMFWCWEFVRLTYLLLAALLAEYFKVKYITITAVVLVWTVHQLTLPYREKIANIIESVIWLIFALILIVGSYPDLSNVYFGNAQLFLCIALLIVIFFSLVVFVIQTVVVMLYRFSKIQAWFEHKRIQDLSRSYKFVFWVIDMLCGDLEAEINTRHEIYSKSRNNIRKSQFYLSQQNNICRIGIGEQSFAKRDSLIRNAKITI